MKNKSLLGFTIGLLSGILVVFAAGFIAITLLEKDGITISPVKKNSESSIVDYLDLEDFEDTADKNAKKADNKEEKSEAEKEDERLRNLFDAKLTYIMNNIDNYYIGEEYNKQEMYDNMLAILIASLGDPYSRYYTSKAFEDEIISVRGNYCGIGATLTQTVDTLDIYIIQPYEDSPAEKAGIRPYDRIIEVNGKSVEGRLLEDVVLEVRGEAGTPVSLTILRGEGENEERLVLDVVREEIVIVDVYSKLIEDDIGYVYISAFNSNTDKQFTAAVDSVIAQGAKALIFDLRGNGGGDVDACSRALDYILPKGEMKFFTEDKSGKKQYEYVKSSHKIDLPIAVLIDGNSASASEIFTGALKDNGVAKVFGTTSFGKGIIQLLQQIPIDNSGFQLTIMKYYTPSGVCIHGIGIDPDVTVELDDEYVTIVPRNREVDNQREPAVEYLKKELQKN